MTAQLTQTNTQLRNSSKVLEDYARKYTEVKEIERQVKKELNDLKSNILDIIGENGEVVAGEFRVQHKTLTVKRKVPITYTIEESASSRFDVKYIGRAAE